MRLLKALGATALVLGVLLAALDAAVVAWFPRFIRVSDNFSTTYLERDVRAVAAAPQVVFIGDSVLWGYRIPAEDAAPALLAREGLPVVNLSFEGGSPANTYALLRLLVADGVRPRLVVFNVNQKEFSPSDSAYQTLHPSLAALALPLLTPDERALLAQPPQKNTLDAKLDRWVTSVWHFYALRSDLREALFGDVDAAHALDNAVQLASGAHARIEAAHRPTPDRFEGTYDLTPLDAQNVSVVFLRKTVELLATAHVPAVAILTPTNHTLLHEFIDSPQYERNLAYTARLLEKGGVRVINLDRSFTAGEFIDNDHLTVDGNRRLAALLRPVLAK